MVENYKQKRPKYVSQYPHYLKHNNIFLRESGLDGSPRISPPFVLSKLKHYINLKELTPIRKKSPTGVTFWPCMQEGCISLYNGSLNVSTFSTTHKNMYEI